MFPGGLQSGQLHGNSLIEEQWRIEWITST